MKKYVVYGEEFVPKFSLPIKGKFKPSDLIKIDLSNGNAELKSSGAKSTEDLHRFVFGAIEKKGAKGAYGGYAEKRTLYEVSEVFTQKGKSRNIHLGVDFWFPSGTSVCAPLPGRVHSFQNNSAIGDYGPTVILEHVLGNDVFYTLYGHLSTRSLENVRVGQMIMRGEVFGYLGKPHENVNWPPHLHFQLIIDLSGYTGDYPGVCFEAEKKKHLKNSPDPIAFFGGFQGVLA